MTLNLLKEGVNMNYFDLINKCLVELNYKKVRAFNEMTKNDHLKLKNILNIINAEICTFDNWNFLLRKKELKLPKNTGELKNTVTGKIHTLKIDNQKYEFTSDFEGFLFNKQKQNTYSVLNEMLLLPLFSEEKKMEIIYYTNNFAKSVNSEEKAGMELEDDEPLIPTPFVEPLLIYGTCMRMKANPQHQKFNYWYGMYKDNLATMRSKLSTTALTNPSIKLNRT